MCAKDACAVRGAAVRDCCARGATPGLRCIHCPVQWSNGAYLVIAGQALYHGITEVAVLCCAVALASYLYHHKRESCFLALDASFAGLIFLMAILCRFDSLRLYGPLHWMVLSSAGGFPVLIWLFVASDLPASAHYDFYHTLWHVATSLGTGAMVTYLSQEGKRSFELFCLEYLVAGVAFALACLWSMRDVVERTFFSHLRVVLEQNSGLDVAVTADNEVIVHGCKVSKGWFWVGLAVQTAGALSIYATGSRDLTLLLLGASVCSFLYHRLHQECELALDLTLCLVSLVTVTSCALMQLGYTWAAEWLVLLGALQLPVVFSWTTLKLSLAQPASRRLCKHSQRCACFKAGTLTSILLDPIARHEFWHHRLSHSLLTLCNLSAATICVATALLS